MHDEDARAGAPSPWDLARADAAFLERVTAAYDGRWNLLDALWWLEHPDSAAPSGTPSPYDQVLRLREAVYGANADPDAVDRYGELRAELAREESAIRSAVRAAHALSPSVPGDGVTGPLTGADAVRSPARRRRWLPLVIGAACIAAVGIGVAGSIAASAPIARHPGASASPTGTSAVGDTSWTVTALPPHYPTAPPTYFSAQQTPSPARTTPTGGVFVFEVPQVASDLPSVATGGALERASFRALPGGEDGVRLYGALMDGEDEICIVAIADDSTVAAGCEPSRSWESVPLRVSLVLPGQLRSSTSGVTRGATITWSADGITFVETSG